MSIFAKLKLSKKQSLTWAALVSSGGIDPAWTKKNYQGLTKAGYKNCMIVYACINKISRACAGIPWMLKKLPQSKNSKVEILEDHPLIDMMRRPNPLDGGFAFTEKVMAYYLLSGNSYIEQAGPGTGENKGVPKELYNLRPDRMTIKKGNASQPVGGYDYKIGSKTVPFNFFEVLHLRTFNPFDDYYGLSPIEAAAKGVDILNMSMDWNMKLLQNDMKPPGYFKVEGSLTDEQRTNMSKMVKDRYQGYEHAGKPLLLEGGTNWIQTAISPKDLDWLNSEKATTRKICSIYNIASELFGDAENKTYSNVKEARAAMYTENIIPHMDYLADEYNNWLTPKFGDYLKLDYNRSAIEALKEEASDVYDRQAKAWWRTLNERRLATGDDEVTGGDVIFIPANLIPLSDVSGNIEEE